MPARHAPRLCRFALTVLAALLAQPAAAAELRPLVRLSGPVVYLRDLFDDAGPNADRVLGPGPAPGARIVVGAAQLGAIARQFAVEWRPASTGDRAVLEWPGKPLRREDALPALREALLAAGADPDCVVELAGFIPPLVPLGADPVPLVTQLDFNAGTGRFTAVLSVIADGMEPLNSRVGGQVDTLIALPVLAVRLPAGAVLRDRDLRVQPVSLSQARGEVLRDPAQAIGQQLRRSVAPGQPLRAEDLARPVVVPKDATVRILLDMRGLSLTGQGTALEPGAIGERIRIRNPVSRATLEAEVVAPGIVRVSPYGLPLLASATLTEPAR